MINPRSIRHRIALIFVLIVSSILVATGAWNYFKLKAEREQQLAAELDGILARLESSLPIAVWDYNEQQIGKTVNSEMVAPFLLGIEVSSRQGSGYSVQRQGDRLVPIASPLSADLVRRARLSFAYQGKQTDLGEVVLYATRQAIVEHQRRDLYALLAAILVTNAVLLFALYQALSVVVLKPLERLQLGVSALEEGRPARPLLTGRDDEIGRLSKSFGHMADTVQNQLVALQDRESYQRLLLDTLVEGLVVRGRDHEVLDFNEAALALFGVSADELRARRAGGADPGNTARYFRPDGYEYVNEELPSRRAVATGAAVRGELMRVRRRDGLEFWATINATPLLRPGEAAAYAVLVAFNDVTRYIVAERELGTSNEELERRVQARTAELQAAMQAVEQASRAKSEFLSRMSHELRTPLNGILGFAQLLAMAQPPLSQVDQRKVEQIETAGWHLLGLIDDVLDLARVEAGAVGISMEPVNTEQVVTETLALVAAMAEERGVTLIDRGASEEAATWVLADRRRLVQVLSNLLSNAVKYNRPHGVVTVAAQPARDGFVTIQVSDTGHGFTAEQLTRLYQPFTRFVKKDGAPVQGTGIGLVITQNLVHLMGGELTVESVAEEGSTFSVKLAAAQTPAQLALAKTVRPAASAAPHASRTERHLLYVEDNPSNVELIEQMVAMRPGYRLTVATDGLSGLAMVRAQMPDLAIIDIDLPGIDGVELCRRLKAEPLTAKLPLIALSANAMPDEVGRARLAGFDVYLTKPMDVVRLLAEIERLLPA